MTEYDIHTSDSQESITSFKLSASPYEIESRFYECIARADYPISYIRTEGMYRHFETEVPSADLVHLLDADSRYDVFHLMSMLVGQADSVGESFPEELSRGASEAYGELTSTLLWSLSRIARFGGVEPSKIQLRSGRPIDIRGFTMEEAIECLLQFGSEIDHITKVVNDDSQPVFAMNQTGNFGMYRRGEEGSVVTTVRLLPQNSHDKSIEYGSSSKGVEASIGHSTDRGRIAPSVYKNEQIDQFCIRIDNEGDSLSLDVGSILGKKGTLGKSIADLIAIGNSDRVDHFYGGKIPKELNHNRTHFSAGQADSEYFAQAVGTVAADLHNRSQANRGQIPARLLLRAGKADA